MIKANQSNVWQNPNDLDDQNEHFKQPRIAIELDNNPDLKTEYDDISKNYLNEVVIEKVKMNQPFQDVYITFLTMPLHAMTKKQPSQSSFWRIGKTSEIAIVK